MGQKVHPYGFRLGINRTWRSRWFARKDYGALLHEDLHLKVMLKKKFAHAGISRIEVESAANKLTIIIFTSRPGIIVGKKGSEIEKLKKDLQVLTGRDINLKIQEVNKPELDAQLVAEGIAQQLEKRIAFRRAMRRAVDSTLRFGAKGIKVRTSGRLNGAEIARTEWYLHGQLPLHTHPRRYRLWFRRSPHDLWRDRRQGLDLQGRGVRDAEAGTGALPVARE